MAAVDNQEGPAAPEIVKLQSNDGRIFEVEKILTKHSVTINTLFRDGFQTDRAVPLPNVDGRTLEKILIWAEYHKDDPLWVEDETKERRTDDIILWDQDFFNVDQMDLFNLIMAANYLDTRALLETGCKTVANMIIENKSPDEIARHFNIVNDYTKEEEEQIRQQNAWEFDEEDLDEQTRRENAWCED